MGKRRARRAKPPPPQAAAPPRRRRLVVYWAAAVLVAAGALAALSEWRPVARWLALWPRGGAADAAGRVSLRWVNGTGRRCKGTVEATNDGAAVPWDFDLADGGIGRLVAAGPLTVAGVVFEREGGKVRREVNVTLQPGTAHEVRIGKDDAVEIVPAGN